MVVAVRAEALLTAQNKLRPGLTAAARDLDRFRSQQKAASAAFATGIAKSFVGIGAAYQALNVARKAITSSISMEREMYNVQRATDATGAALKKNEDFILDLARATGKTKEELAQMFAAGGFAGRPAHELQRFTEYASKATVAWGIDAKETGQALAEIGNIYGANQKRIEQIGDTINSVADASASGENDLIEILRRVGGAGHGIGVSAENMLGLGAALKEVGVRTDVAATGLNALITKISTPDDGFDEALVSAGLNAKKFRKSVEKDAVGAIMTLLKALGKAQGTKRMGILKEMFGMEYADDIGRLVGALPRVVKLLELANDKKKAWGSVHKGFADALEKDFNKLDRANQSIDVFLKNVGDWGKGWLGAAAEQVNQAVDHAERVERRLRAIREIDKDVSSRASDPSAPEVPKSTKDQDIQTIKDLAAGKYDAASLPYVVAYAQNDEVRRAAEDAYRRQRFRELDQKDNADEDRAWGNFNRMSAGDPYASKVIPTRDRSDLSAKYLADFEAIRQRRMRNEFEDMRVSAIAGKSAAASSAGLGSMDRLLSFSNLPITLGKGKAAKTFEAPKLELDSAGATAGSQFVSALNAELDRGMAEIAGKLQRLKTMMSFSASPSVNVTFGTSVSGLNTGRQGAE